MVAGSMVWLFGTACDRFFAMPELQYCYEYPRPAVAVDLLVVRQGLSDSKEILLVQRGNEPYKGKWALPGGFLEEDETLEQGAIRELKEETGVDLTLDDLIQMKAYSQPDRDPRTRVISVVFGASVPAGTNVVANDDAADARWFAIDDLPTPAFDHALIIKDCLTRMS